MAVRPGDEEGRLHKTPFAQVAAVPPNAGYSPSGAWRELRVNTDFRIAPVNCEAVLVSLRKQFSDDDLRDAGIVVGRPDQPGLLNPALCGRSTIIFPLRGERGQPPFDLLVEAGSITGIGARLDGGSRPQGPRRRLELKDIRPDRYELHRLGRVTVVPRSLVWLSAHSWAVGYGGEFLYRPDVDKAWDVYVSLKFEGPLHAGSKGTRNRILCDRIVFIK
jgi:hypothetical protein